MAMLYLALALSGVALICWGLPASHRLRSPWDILAALAFLAGVLAAIAGVLLIAAPRFFQG